MVETGGALKTTQSVRGAVGRVRVHARVIAHDGEALVLADHEGTLRVAWRASELIDGSWVAATFDGDGAVLRCASIEVETVPFASYPRAGGDVRWFHDDQRKRLTALVQRCAILRAIRYYFHHLDFVEVETPQMVPSPGLDVHLEAFEIGNRKRAGESYFLHTSPEFQMKRLLVAGLPRIMQICRASRRGELGQRHEPEFTMLEWYRSFAGSEDVMRDTEALVAQVAVGLLGTTQIRGPKGNMIDLAAPWERMTVAQAFTNLAQVAVEDVLPDEEKFFLILTETIEPQLGRDRPVFLTEWPASMASLARTFPERPHLADRFEAFVDGMELCNGFGELIDPIEQRSRFVRDQAKRGEMGLAVYPLDERFLSSLEEGMPPSGGNALGVDRLVMLLTGAEHIEDCVAFGAERV